MKNRKPVIKVIGGEVPTNGASNTIEASAPYRVEVTLRGTTDLLFHRWNVDVVKEKAKARKGSEIKKTDDLETFVYRTDAGELAMPGEYLRQSIIIAAKYKQDPR